MRSTEEIIVKIFNDNNLDKNERYMLLMFIANNKGSNEPISMSLKIIMDYFQYKSKDKVTAILRSLESKMYIEIIKESGKINKYKIIKYSCYEEVNNDKDINKCNSRDMASENLSSSTSLIEQSGIEKLTGTSSQLEQTGIEKLTGTTSELEQTSIEKLTSITSELEQTSIKKLPSTSILGQTSSENLPSTSLLEQPGSSIYINTGTNKNIAYKSPETLENTSFTGEVISLDQKRNIYNNINNNIYINNNKLYINIFNTWNKTSINTEKILSNEIKKAIYNSLEVYGEEKILKAIENYSEVFYGDHYYNYRWSLLSFLTKSNGIKRFMENGDMWLDYKYKKQDTDDNFDDDFDIQQYIDY